MMYHLARTRTSSVDAAIAIAISSVLLYAPKRFKISKSLLLGTEIGVYTLQNLGGGVEVERPKAAMGMEFCDFAAERVHFKVHF